MNATILSLAGYMAWTVLLVIAIGGYRTMLVMQKDRAPNEFKPDGSDSPEFGYRLGRVFGNCVESFPFICGPMLLALAADAAVITNSLALILLAARLGQSITHILSTSVMAVQVRFAFFLIQIGIVLYWLWQIINRFAG